MKSILKSIQNTLSIQFISPNNLEDFKSSFGANQCYTTLVIQLLRLD